VSAALQTVIKRGRERKLSIRQRYRLWLHGTKRERVRREVSGALQAVITRGRESEGGILELLVALQAVITRGPRC